MKIGGIVIINIGATLFIWHLIKVGFNPDYVGYASHQVMALNAVVVIIFGTVIYFMARRRERRKRRSGNGGDAR